MKIFAARVFAALLIAAAAFYALHRWTLVPLRCARAASNGAIALDDAHRSEAAERRIANIVLASLRGCECSSYSRARILATRGNAFHSTGNPHSAIADYHRSLTTDRRPHTYLTLGLAQLDALDRPAALASLERACAYDPSRLSAIPYDAIRREVEERLRAKYGEGW